jgi:hypothetical protein
VQASNGRHASCWLPISVEERAQLKDLQARLDRLVPPSAEGVQALSGEELIAQLDARSTLAEEALEWVRSLAERI